MTKHNIFDISLIFFLSIRYFTELFKIVIVSSHYRQQGKTCEAVRTGFFSNKMSNKSNFSIEVTIANCSGTMEADTISKNGINRKYLKTSRFNLFLVASIFACSLFMVSCRTASYLPTNVYSNKLQPLMPEIDALSIETHFVDGSTHSQGYGVANRVGTVAVISSNSTYFKNPQIKYLRDVFTEETFRISEKFGERKGSIIWSIEYYDKSKRGAGLLFIIPPASVLYLFGVPWCSYTDCFRIKADIYDKNNNMVASYESKTKCKKYYQAMWWGYSGSTARSMAFVNSLTEAISEVKSQIMNNKEHISTQLGK